MANARKWPRDSIIASQCVFESDRLAMITSRDTLGFDRGVTSPIDPCVTRPSGVVKFRFIFEGSGGGRLRLGGESRLSKLSSSTVPNVIIIDYSSIVNSTDGMHRFWHASTIKCVDFGK